MIVGKKVGIDVGEIVGVEEVFETTGTNVDVPLGVIEGVAIG